MGKLLQHLREEPSVGKERVLMKKLVLLGMIASLVLHPASVTRAADLQETGAESEEEMRERVFEEVLTGEITNDEDVIRVALE